MRLGYNTNGLAHHKLFDAVRLLAEIGYESVAITIDHNALPPYAQPTRRAAVASGCGDCSTNCGCGRSSRPAARFLLTREKSTSRR